jgi:hypothetical protein
MWINIAASVEPRYHQPMTGDQPRTVANGRDRSPDHQYSLSVEQTADLYAAAGLSRSIRAIQKYCALTKLDCHKVETGANGRDYSRFGSQGRISRAQGRRRSRALALSQASAYGPGSVVVKNGITFCRRIFLRTLPYVCPASSRERSLGRASIVKSLIVMARPKRFELLTPRFVV